MKKRNDIKYLAEELISKGSCKDYSLEFKTSGTELARHAKDVPEDNLKKGKAGTRIAKKIRRDTLERDLMIKQNLGLVYFFAKRMANSTLDNHQDFEDLVSVGTLGLIYAVDNRDLDKCKKEWQVYVATCIRAKMLRHISKNKNRALEIEHNEKDFEEEEIVDNNSFYEMIDMLEDSRQKDFLEDKYVYGQNCADIGRKYGMSRERARQLIMLAEENLKNMLIKLEE